MAAGLSLSGEGGFGRSATLYEVGMPSIMRKNSDRRWWRQGNWRRRQWHHDLLYRSSFSL